LWYLFSICVICWVLSKTKGLINTKCSGAINCSYMWMPIFVRNIISYALSKEFPSINRGTRSFVVMSEAHIFVELFEHEKDEDAAGILF